MHAAAPPDLSPLRAQGGRLHAACDAALVEPFAGFPRVGHNDIHSAKAYTTTLSRFLADTVVGGWKPPGAPAADAASTSEVCQRCAVQ